MSKSYQIKKPSPTIAQHDGRIYWRSEAEMTRATAKYADILRNTLLRRARDAAGCSYSPYSKFRVGAACVDGDGMIYEGTNVENASYGLTMCAERVAIFKAISCGAKRIEQIAVACVDASDASVSRMPCGACRQVMAEFMIPDGLVHIDGVDTHRLSNLLPMAFRL